MASELVRLRLPDFDLDAVGGLETGVDPSVIASACDGLTEQVQSLKAFSQDLSDKQQSIVSGWEGEAAEMLKQLFPELIDAFDEIPVCINSIAEWATSYAEAMVEIDKSISDNLAMLK